MQLEEVKRKLKSPILWGNLLAMTVFCIIVILGVLFGLDAYTHHGEEIEVPDLTGKTYADSEYLLSHSGLRVEVGDSGYMPTLPPGSVLAQIPAAGSRVKSGRIVYLTINSLSTPTLSLPDLADNSSYREAEARLRAMGFKLMPPEYVDGEKDWVYGVKSQGRLLYAGQQVPISHALTLQVGRGTVNIEDSLEYYGNAGYPEDFSTDGIPSEPSKSDIYVEY